MALTEEAGKDWWERWNGLLQAELDAFAARGASARIVSQANGFLIMAVDWPLDDRTIRLDVGFSPLHPYFRPTVTTADLQLARHQHPFDGGLCLLVQGSGQWHGGERVADLIASQLASIISVNRLRAEGDWAGAAELEEQAADPLAAYLAGNGEECSAVLMASAPAIPRSAAGPAQFAVQWRSTRRAQGPFEAVLRKCEPASGSWLAPAFDLPQPHGEWHRLPGRWVRLAGPLPDDPAALLEMADAAYAQLALADKALRSHTAKAQAELSITAIVYEDELHYGPGGRGDNLLFLAVRSEPGKPGKRNCTLVRGFRVGEDRLARLPVAATLRARHVLLLGCGAIGSFVALELARAGVGQLRLVDHDLVEPGNSVRWPLGRPYWGLPKVAALHAFLSQNYPWTATSHAVLRIGGALADPEGAAKLTGNPRAQLREMIAEADLVIDATASDECQLAVAHLCRDLAKPLVVGHATEGLAGGAVVRLRPERPGCLACLHDHWSEGSVALPPIDPSGTITPLGCNMPTFTGGAFDLEEVSLEMVRSAIGLLAPDVRDPGDWDWSTLALVGEEGRRLPAWSSGKIVPRATCACSRA